MHHHGGGGDRGALIGQLREGLEDWKLREATFRSLAAEADRLGRDGDGCSVELQSLVNALATATVLARSCRLACAAMLASAG